MRLNKLYFAEDNDTTPDHADDLEQVLLEAGLEYLSETSPINSDFE